VTIYRVAIVCSIMLLQFVAETGMVVHKGCVEKAKDMQGNLLCLVNICLIDLFCIFI